MDGTGSHYLVCWVWQRAMPGLCVSSERAGWEEGKGKSEFTEGFTEGDAEFRMCRRGAIKANSYG